MVFVNSGLGSQLLYAPETSWGTAAVFSTSSTSSSFARPLEFTSETLALVKNTVQGQGIHAGGLYNRAPRRVVTYYGANGGVTMDLPTQYMNELWKILIGSKGSSAATLQSTSAVAGVASSAGMYLAGHSPIATGATGTQGASLTLQKGVAAVDGTAANPFTYTGVKVTDWTLNVATGAIATLQFNIDGYNELAGTVGSAPANGDPKNATVPALATYSEAATNNIFHFREATLNQVNTKTTTGGLTTVTSSTALGMVRSAEVKQTFGFDTARYFLGGNGFKSEQVENTWRGISGQFVVDFSTAETMYAAFAADTQVSLQLTFAASSTSLLQILIPAIYLDGESPKVSGPGVVQQTLSFTGLDNGTDAPIQVVYGTIDSV